MRLPTSEGNDEQCKGLYYRLFIESYVGNDGSIVNRERFRPVKSLPCEGCEDCAWVLELMKEDVGTGGFPVINDGDLVGRGLYRLDYKSWQNYDDERDGELTLTLQKEKK